MTTEELEKKLKINKNTCIHCPTEELAKHVLSILHQLGLKWCSGNSYIIHTGWDNHKENTIYYPFDGERSSLEFAHLAGFKIINAKEFIALHRREELIALPTEGEEFDLESYSPKGELEGFPKEIISRMLDYQEEQGNPRDISVFETIVAAVKFDKGFAWNETKEGLYFWLNVINNKDFNLFFEKYPKQDNPQDNPQELFRVGDEVIDIITRQRGKIFEINPNDGSILSICVSFNKGEDVYYALNSRCYIGDEYRRLLHYRDDYDYSIIDFNNLPKRQDKRWRAKVGGKYYSFTSNFKVEEYTEDNDYYYDNIDYNSGNYFQTKEEAQKVADKLNKYFQELINPNKQNEERN